MQGWDSRRWTGAVGLVWVAVQVVGVVLFLVAGNPPDFGDAKKFTGWINTSHGQWYVTQGLVGAIYHTPLDPGRMIVATLTLQIANKPGTYRLSVINGASSDPIAVPQLAVASSPFANAYAPADIAKKAVESRGQAAQRRRQPDTARPRTRSSTEDAATCETCSGQ